VLRKSPSVSCALNASDLAPHNRFLIIPFQPCNFSSSKMPSENLHYFEVILDDQSSAARVGDLARRDPWSALKKAHSGREIHVIVGSPSKPAKATVAQFAKELTSHLRLGQDWRSLNVTVQQLESGELPPLGTPAHTDGDLTAWIVD
jgi:hypothetical protein